MFKKHVVLGVFYLYWFWWELSGNLETLNDWVNCPIALTSLTSKTISQQTYAQVIWHSWPENPPCCINIWDYQHHGTTYHHPSKKPLCCFLNFCETESRESLLSAASHPTTSPKRLKVRWQQLCCSSCDGSRERWTKWCDERSDCRYPVSSDWC